MKSLLIAAACILAFAGPALACRGTAEVPQVAEQLKESQASAETLRELTKQFNAVEALHNQAHGQGDTAKMKDAMRMLDEIKAKLGK
jgi:hypothetical protein